MAKRKIVFLYSTVWHPSASPELAAVNESHLSLWKVAENGAQVGMDTASMQFVIVTDVILSLAAAYLWKASLEPVGRS